MSSLPRSSVVHAKRKTSDGQGEAERRNAFQPHIRLSAPTDYVQPSGNSHANEDCQICDESHSAYTFPMSVTKQLNARSYTGSQNPGYDPNPERGRRYKWKIIGDTKSTRRAREQ